MDYTIIGIDVSKNNLDVCFLPSEQSITISNDKSGYKQLTRKIGKCKTVKILLESTGCYHKNIQSYLLSLDFSVYILNPKQVRDYAKSCGRLAKTDKIDALMIARYGQTHEVRLKGLSSVGTERFKLLIERRRQIIRMRTNEKIHAEKYRVLNDKPVLRFIESSIMFYDKQLSDIDSSLALILEQCSELKTVYSAITEVRGVGPATAYDIMADMPELGSMSKREVAALAGVAPMNCDSGGMRGQRHIKGGRFYVRQALYMACLSGIRYNPVIGAYYRRLRYEGKKPFKVAMVACMRKMILHLNSVCAAIK